MNDDRIRKTALSFIILMGVVSLFSDMTHEGAASIIGAYLSMAGASASSIGFITGLGALIGYSLRLFSGFLADRTKCYWPITRIGYIVDCFAIPALALIPDGGWVWACLLIVLQRFGKAVKKPAKDTLLSFAATKYGVGKSFAIEEFLDQIGAIAGPGILFLVLLLNKGSDTFHAYKICFAVLGIPAIITIALLLFAKRKFPEPEKFEPTVEKKDRKVGHNLAFILYLTAISLFAAGFLGFPLITMHADKTGMLSRETLPLIYSGAMAVDAFAALAFGWMYDKYGIKVLIISTFLAAPSAALVFGCSNIYMLMAGVALWGIGMGAQESILKSAVATLIPKEKRSAGFGIFQTAFGICFFLGSWLTGYLYDNTITGMIIFSVAMQILAIPFFWLADSFFKHRSSTPA